MRKGSQCFVLITSEMLTRASLGTVRVGAQGRLVFLQTVRESPRQHSGWAGASSWEESSLAGSCHHQHHAAISSSSWPWAWPPYSAWPVPLGEAMGTLVPAHRSGAMGGQVVGRSKTCGASLPWVPWAALGSPETARHTYFKHQCNGLWPIEG